MNIHKVMTSPIVKPHALIMISKVRRPKYVVQDLVIISRDLVKKVFGVYTNISLHNMESTQTSREIIRRSRDYFIF